MSCQTPNPTPGQASGHMSGHGSDAPSRMPLALPSLPGASRKIPIFGRLAPLWRIPRLAIGALWAFRVRSLFVIAAVALGIAAVAIIVASVDGAQRKARELVEIFGPDAVLVISGDTQSRASGRRTLTLSLDDAEAMRRSLPGAYLVVAMRGRSSQTLRFRNRNMVLSRVIGATENYSSAWNWPLDEGRDLTEEDIRLGRRVGLIADTPARELFGDESPLGKTVYLSGIPIRIVGRLTPRGVTGGGARNVDERLVIPLSTLTQRFNLNRRYYSALRVKFEDTGRIEAQTENLRSFLRHQHGLRPGEPDDFRLIGATEILKFLSIIQGGLVVFLGVTAGVTLLVGGFVLANLFYLSVEERSAEIGLKKALGAKQSAVLLQFLAEAVALTTVGAVIGMFLGIGMGSLLERFDLLEIHLTGRVAVASFISSLAVGLIFGLRPARRAARLDPIAALKG